MILRSLALTNFKNIPEAVLDFSPKVNCLLGDNGMGKSNLLDAIYFLSFTKSYSRLPDSMLIRSGENFGIVRGTYLRQDTEEEIVSGLRAGQRKTFRRGGKEYKRLSAHIGLLPAVMVAPTDNDIVTGASDERRRFADQIISQSDPAYLEALLRYSQALEQRNRMLRDSNADRTLYEAIELTMAAAAEVIRRGRREFIHRLTALFEPYHTALSGGGETPALRLVESGSDHDDLLDALEHARTRDSILKYTTVGPHRDDIELTLDGMPLRRTGSQGQIKTFTLALRFAQYRFLSACSPVKPLLLLDDIFDKLDARRVQHIIRLVSGNEFGQIFITDTNRKHLDEIMETIGGDYRMWQVTDGQFSLITGHEED